MSHNDEIRIKNLEDTQRYHFERIEDQQRFIMCHQERIEHLQQQSRRMLYIAAYVTAILVAFIACAFGTHHRISELDRALKAQALINQAQVQLRENK